MFRPILMGLLMAAAPAAGAEGMRDPTQPPLGSVPAADAGAAPAEIPLQLNMTKVGGGRPLAIINGVTAAVGDQVGGARVTAIRSGEVDLVVGGRKQTLTMPGAALKKSTRIPGGGR